MPEVSLRRVWRFQVTVPNGRRLGYHPSRDPREKLPQRSVREKLHTHCCRLSWNKNQRVQTERKMIGEKGKLLYNVYRALTYGLSPFLYLHLRFRTLQGIEHPVRWPERLGRPSTSRPPGHLIWFHTASLGPVQLFFLLFFYAIKRNLDLLISSFLFLNLLSLLLGESLVKTQVRGFWIFIFNI